MTEKTTSAKRRSEAGQSLDLDYSDPDVIKLLKAEVCPPGTTDTEFKIFIAKCKQSGLNPFLGECFCVERWTSIYDRQKSDYVNVKRNQFQAAEAGMAARAERFDDYGGIRFGMVYAKDVCEVDPTGSVNHKYNLTADRGAPIAAWAQVIRDDYFFSPEIVLLKDFIQLKKGNGKEPGGPTAMWKKPDIMLPKCARAAAYRRAYPRQFADVYAQEELPENDHAETPRANKAPTSAGPPSTALALVPQTTIEADFTEDGPEPERVEAPSHDEDEVDRIAREQEAPPAAPKPTGELSEYEKMCILLDEAIDGPQLNKLAGQVTKWPNAEEQVKLRQHFTRRGNDLRKAGK
jgi:phage recombination protein Bet